MKHFSWGTHHTQESWRSHYTRNSKKLDLQVDALIIKQQLWVAKVPKIKPTTSTSATITVNISESESEGTHNLPKGRQSLSQLALKKPIQHRSAVQEGRSTAAAALCHSSEGLLNIKTASVSEWNPGYEDNSDNELGPAVLQSSSSSSDEQLQSRRLGKRPAVPNTNRSSRANKRHHNLVYPSSESSEPRQKPRRIKGAFF